MGYFYLTILVGLHSLATHCDGLQCYMCPSTSRESSEDANLDCLSMGWELSCAPDQDRCYSTTLTNSTGSHVEKGCARSQSCLSPTTCCQTDYCNAAFDQTGSKTGYGKPCIDIGSCVQGSPDMRCVALSIGSGSKTCQCADRRYNEGAICRRQSNPDELCRRTEHCFAVNSTCQRNVCRCHEGLYANITECLPQKSLREPCLTDKECGGSNTACNGVQCACEFGFLAINGTDSCSGSPRPGNHLCLLLLASSITAFLCILLCRI